MIIRLLNLVAQEYGKDSKLSSSLPHRCACCAKVLCATLHSVVSVQTVPHLSSLASTSFRSSSHCVSLAVRVLSFGVKHVCFVGTLTFVSFCNVLHVFKTSWSAISRCHCDRFLPFRLGLHQSLAILCPLVLKRLLGHLDWISLLRFRVAFVIAAVADTSWM